MTKLRTAFVTLALLACAVCSSHSNAPVLVRLKIAPQPIDRAINIWALRMGMQVLVPTDGLREDTVSPAIAGYYTPEGALGVLLANTGLRYELVKPNTIAIYHVPSAARSVITLTARQNVVQPRVDQPLVDR